MSIEKVAIYCGGAFAIAITLWVFIAFMRAEGILDLRMGLIGLIIVLLDRPWRRRGGRGSI